MWMFLMGEALANPVDTGIEADVPPSPGEDRVPRR